MIESLNIRNYALADRLNVEFEEGLNILSGETGSGKSVIVGALDLVIGGKADVSVIRTGEDETEVTAFIYIGKNPDAGQWLQSREIEPEDDRVIIRRTLKQTGRGGSFIQSTQVTKADMSEFTSLLFDIHGQHEHQSLLGVENHRKLLDSFGGLDDEAGILRERFLELSTVKKELQKLNSDEREMLRESEIAAYAVREIESANLVPGELEQLEDEHKLLSQAERMFIAFEKVHDNLNESGGGALKGLRDALAGLNELRGIDRYFEEPHGRLENAFYETEDILDGLERYRDSFDFSPERLASCEERLSELHKLRKKYGDTVEEILAFLEQSRKKVDGIENSEELKKQYSEKAAALEKDVLARASSLSAKRKEAAGKLEKAVQQQLVSLGMPKAQFCVPVEQRQGENNRPSCGVNGFDMVEFLISPNQGEPPKKLRSIASGGEISRVMLAIKSVLADIDTVDCMVFDEIDSGIGGEIAVAVGEHLHNLSKYKQILCITHLASIAVRADNHIRVVKDTRDGRTFTDVQCITGKDRTVEVARMLSGDTNAEVSLQHAEEMLSRAGRSGGG